MLQHRPTVHWVLLFLPVQVQRPSDAISHHSKGHVRALTAQRKYARYQPASFIPARPITDIFILTGDIGGQGRGRGHTGRSERVQEPEGRQGCGRQSRGRIREGVGATSRETGAVKRKAASTNTSASRESRRRHEPTAQLSSDEAGEE